MAVKRGTSRATGRSGRAESRISLTRPGSKGSANAWKARPEPKVTRRRVNLPKISLSLWASRLLIAFSAIILLCSVSFGFIYCYRYVTTTPYFELKSIEIEGNTRLSSKNILDLVKIHEGMNVFSLSIKRIENVLQKHPWLQRVSVTRIIPDTLIIKLTEKNPAYWVLVDRVLWYTDETGNLIAPVEAGFFSPLPTLVIEKGAESYASMLPELMQSIHEANLPIDTAAISHIWLSASKGLEFFVGGTNLKIAVGLDGWMQNLHRAKATLEDLLKRGELPQIRIIRALGHNVWVEAAQPL